MVIKNKAIALIIACILVLALITVLYLYLAGKATHRKVINEFILSQGGTVMNIESVSLDSTPFPVYSENARRKQNAGNQFYKVTYSQNGTEHTAWYRGVNGSYAIHRPTQTRSGEPINETPETEEFIYNYGERWIFSN